jgi:hypothetical protein
MASISDAKPGYKFNIAGMPDDAASIDLQISDRLAEWNKQEGRYKQKMDWREYQSIQSGGESQIRTEDQRSYDSESINTS